MYIKKMRQSVGKLMAQGAQQWKQVEWSHLHSDITLRCKTLRLIIKLNCLLMVIFSTTGCRMTGNKWKRRRDDGMYMVSGSGKLGAMTSECQTHTNPQWDEHEVKPRCCVTLMKVEEGWRVEMRVKDERLRERVSEGLRERERCIWLLKKEWNNKRTNERRRKMGERGQHELSVEGLGGTRWETHAVKHTQWV